MADTTFTTNAGSGGASFVADADGSSNLWPYVKLSFGGSGTQTRVTTAAGLPVQQQSGATFAVAGPDADGAATTGNPVLIGGFDGTNTQSVSTTSSGHVQIHDGGNSITVDNGGTFAVQATVAAGATTIAKAEDVASADADVGVPAMAIRKATPANTSGTDGDYEMLQMSAGRLWVDPSGVTLTVASHAVTNAGTFAVQADSVIPGSGATNLGKAEDAAHSSGDVGVMALSVRQNTAAATSGADGDYQPLITDTNGRLHVLDANSASALTSLQLIDDPVIADDAAFTPATSKVMMAGFEADESSTDSVDEGDAGAARMTLDRKIITTLQPHTAGGLSTFMASGSDGSSILVATAQAIKASAGQLYGYYLYNPEAAATFVHFYNTAAASVTVGTTNPLFTVVVPAGAAANLSIPQGITFSNAGWSCAATTTAGGNTAPATGVSLVAWYA